MNEIKLRSKRDRIPVKLLCKEEVSSWSANLMFSPPPDYGKIPYKVRRSKRRWNVGKEKCCALGRS